MTAKQIIKFNILCSEFLGAQINTTLERIYIDRMKDNEMIFHNFSVNLQMYEWSGTTNIHYITFDMLQFHHDWNWIMMVIEEIEKLDKNKEFAIIKKTAYLMGGFGAASYKKTKKEAVIKVISEFLTNYKNEQIQTNKHQHKRRTSM